MEAQREREIRRELLIQRLTHLEAERVAAIFAVEQIDASIAHTRQQLDGGGEERGS